MIAITIILIVAMICTTVLLCFYWNTIHEKCNTYTLNDVKYTQEQIRESIKYVEEQLKEKK